MSGTVFAFLCTLVFGFSSVADESLVWSLTALDSKQVKVDGQLLKKGTFWEFTQWAQLETHNAEAMISLPGQYYLKLHKNTHLRWADSVLQLLSGKVYIKNLSENLTLQIPSFFKFKITSSDLVASFDRETKRSEFEILTQNQAIQIDSDDREIPTVQGTRLSFQPEYVDGEIAYDFLLNDRKIPKMHMEKNKIEKLTILEANHWKVSLKKATTVKKQAAKKAKIDSSKFICKKPNGVLSACIFVKESSNCARYTCNLSGEWTLRTTFEKNDLCPSTKTIKDCEWLGR